MTATSKVSKLDHSTSQNSLRLVCTNNRGIRSYYVICHANASLDVTLLIFLSYVRQRRTKQLTITLFQAGFTFHSLGKTLIQVYDEEGHSVTLDSLIGS